MAEILKDRKYTAEHEWVLVQGNQAKIGITDYAQSELGDIVYVDLPEVGGQVEKGKAMGTIEAVKTVAELFSPLTGTVASVNDAIQENAGLVNEDCYDKGWLLSITLDEASPPEDLLDPEAYEKLITE